MRFFLIMPTATCLLFLEVLSTTSAWKTINDNFSCLVSWHFHQRFQVWNNKSLKVSAGGGLKLDSPPRAKPHMTKLHHELGVKTLVRITSEVIIEVPPTRVAVVAVGPGRLQPVQVGDQRLHHLRLYELSPWSLYGGWMPLPRTNIFSSFE